MNRKYATIGFIASALLIGSTAIFAADNATSTSLEAGLPETAPPATAESPAPTTKTTTTTEPVATTAPAATTTTTTTTTTEPVANPTPAATTTTEPVATPAPTATTTTTTTTEPVATPAPAATTATTTTTEPVAPAAKLDSAKKPLAKVTCEDFLAFDEVIQPKYVIAAEPYAKNGKAKSVVIDVLATETLIPVLIEECTKTPKKSFLAQLKSKLKHK